MIFKPTWHKGERVLDPVKHTSKIITQAYEAAARIPGARVTLEEGQVTGGHGALAAVLDAAGEPLPADLAWAVHLDGGKFRREQERARNLHTLPKFQRYGGRFTYQRVEHGVMNNDDMGLGKTVQTIAGLCMADMEARKVILCPAFLRPQWESEIKKWAPVFGDHEPVTQIIWPRSSSKKKLRINPDAQWIIAYYMDAERAVDVFGYEEYFLVVDEVHNLRGLQAKRYEEVSAVSLLAQGRVALTASELYNDVRGLWPVYNIVSPGHWGARGAFLRRYGGATFNEYGGLDLPRGEDGEYTINNLEELNNRRGLHGFRRTKEDVWDQLPFDTKFQVTWLESPPGGASVLAAAHGGMTERQQHLDQVSAFKVPMVAEQLHSDANGGIASLTFTYSRKQAAAIAAEVRGSLLLTGDTSTASNRLAKLNTYVAKCKAEHRAAVVVATMDALSEGANAQWAKVVNFAALDATPDKIRQCLARSARMGQEGTVIVRVFACKNTIDEHLAKLARNKLHAQYKLDGRKEEGKADLDDALSPPRMKEALEDMWERYQKAEQADPW